MFAEGVIDVDAVEKPTGSRRRADPASAMVTPWKRCVVANRR